MAIYIASILYLAMHVPITTIAIAIAIEVMTHCMDLFINSFLGMISTVNLVNHFIVFKKESDY